MDSTPCSDCHESGMTGSPEPPPGPPLRSPPCGSSSFPLPQPRLSYAPRRIIPVLGNIAPAAIFLRILDPVAGRPGSDTCVYVSALLYLRLSFSVWVSGCLLSLSLLYYLHVCLALLCVMFIAYLVVLARLLTVLHVCLALLCYGKERARAK